MPLIFLGGGWGYYDAGHNWHHAPDSVSRHLEQQRASGATFRTGGAGYQQPRQVPAAEPNRVQPQYRPVATPYSAPRQAPAAQPGREEHERERKCEAGQRC
jgi:hypothetical protein